MSEEFDSTPLILFTTRTNTELGAESVAVDGDDIVLGGVLKKVTEAMLASYPRTMLGKWTPNRYAVRYPRAEIAERKVKNFETGAALDVDAVVGLAG